MPAPRRAAVSTDGLRILRFAQDDSASTCDVAPLVLSGSDNTTVVYCRKSTIRAGAWIDGRCAMLDLQRNSFRVAAVPILASGRLSVGTALVATFAVTTTCSRATVDEARLSQASCPRPVVGIDTLLRPGTALLLGELHGTQEAPRFVGDVACHAVERRVPVTIALELPLDVANHIQTYLTSPNDGRRTRAVAAIFTSTWQDGRRSQAIAALLDTARALEQRGFDVRVIPFSADSAASGQLRDRGMADALAQAFRDSSRMLIMLAGNLHVRLRSGTAITRDYEPAGFLLRQRFPTRTVVSLDMANDSGSAWLCTSADPKDCGVKPVRARNPAAPWLVQLSDSLSATGYHGVFTVGAPHASPPVRANPVP